MLQQLQDDANNASKLNQIPNVDVSLADRCAFKVSFLPRCNFRQICESMKDVSIVMTFTAHPQGLYMVACNVTKVCLGATFIAEDKCKLYAYPTTTLHDATPAAPLVFAIKLYDLILSMKPSKKKDKHTITLTLPLVRAVVNEDVHGDEHEDGERQSSTTPTMTRLIPDPADPFLYLDFVNDQTRDSKPRVRLPLLPKPPRIDVQSLSTLENASTICLPSQELKRLALECTIMGTTTRLQLYEHKLELHAGTHLMVPSPDQPPMHMMDVARAARIICYTRQHGCSDDLVIRLHPYHAHLAPLTQHFASRFFNFFTAKPCQLAKRVTIGMTPGRPLIVHYDLNDDIGTITYYLAEKHVWHLANPPPIRAVVVQQQNAEMEDEDKGSDDSSASADEDKGHVASSECSQSAAVEDSNVVAEETKKVEPRRKKRVRARSPSPLALRQTRLRKRAI